LLSSSPLAEEPHRAGAPLRAPFEGHWRATRGDYRVRYTINEDGNETHVLDIDHLYRIQAEAYK